MNLPMKTKSRVKELGLYVTYICTSIQLHRQKRRRFSISVETELMQLSDVVTRRSIIQCCGPGAVYFWAFRVRIS
jgi:hypothetical protein